MDPLRISLPDWIHHGAARVALLGVAAVVVVGVFDLDVPPVAGWVLPPVGAVLWFLVIAGESHSDRDRREEQERRASIEALRADGYTVEAPPLPLPPQLEGEHVVIADRIARDYAAELHGLDVKTLQLGADLAIYGADLDRFLERIDPSTWDAARSRGDA